MENILEVQNLSVSFESPKGEVQAVRDVSFSLKKGEVLAIVGESGCGKTTCGRTCVVVYEVADGEVLYKGRNIHKMSNAEKKEFTKHVQMSF